MATITKKKTAAAPSSTRQPGADYGRDGMVIPQGHPEQMLEQQPGAVELSVPGSGEYDTRPLFGASAVQFIRLSMFNPLRGFSPRRLSSWIEEQEAGQLSGALRAWEAMARRDDAIVTVKGKKEDAVAMRGYALLEGAAIKEQRGLLAEAKSQRERLRYFWENMRCVSAWDRNVTGGFSLFTRLCVHIQSMRYGAIHFNWRITAKGLTAELEFVPGWLFENLTGELRFLGTNPSCVYGMPLDTTNWLPIAGRGIMEAASIAYGYKHLGLETWIKYCARYGMPFPIGTCPSGPQSPEWAQMKAAIKGINDDGGAVIGEGAKIELLKAEGSAGVSPSKDLVERLDRALSAMFRGGDLSTMSSTSGHGTGSNQQTGESLLIEAADCQFVSEIMQAIERKVLDYYDGEEAEALVYGQIKGPSLNDAAQELRVDEFAVKYGVRLSIKDWAERHNRALADEDEPVLEPKPQADPSAEGHHGDDDDGKAVNFDPNEPRDASGRWTAGAGVGRKGPQIKTTHHDETDAADADEEDAIKDAVRLLPDDGNGEAKVEHAVYTVPMVDGKPDFSKATAHVQLMKAKSKGGKDGKAGGAKKPPAGAKKPSTDAERFATAVAQIVAGATHPVTGAAQLMAGAAQLAAHAAKSAETPPKQPEPKVGIPENILKKAEDPAIRAKTGEDDGVFETNSINKVHIDNDGDPKAYIVPGQKDADGNEKLGNDNLGNASHKNPETGKNEYRGEAHLSSKVLLKGEDGEWVKRKIDGFNYYVPKTTWEDNAATGGGTLPEHFVDATKIPYVAITEKWAKKLGAKMGQGFFLVQNLNTGKSVVAILADSRGENKDRLGSIEMSPAAAHAVDISHTRKSVTSFGNKEGTPVQPIRLTFLGNAPKTLKVATYDPNHVPEVKSPSPERPK